jgi:crotonobetainyl-CoA:carnitine CoA-transferase CaiB-like acyl-CoA transferase
VSGPLAGIKVLEAGHMLAGPYCGLLLADLGAEVTKIEPAEGDIARRLGGHSVGPHNTYFASLNRNKRSVVLDLASAAGTAALHELARDSHAVISNMRPAVIRKLGLTYAALASVNPRLVCVALTGFGMESPYSDRPAYDYVIQAMTGMMTMTGAPDDPPTKAGYSAVDNSAGIMAALGLVAKIVEGRGGQVDVAMYDVMLSQMNYLASAWLNAGERARRFASSAHPFIVPAQVFPTADGWLVLFVTHDEFWARFCREVGRPEWIVDLRFATMEARRLNRDAVIEAVAAVLVARPAAEWVQRFVPLGIVASGIQSLEDALASEQAQVRRMVVEIPTPDGPIRAVGNPIKLDGCETRYQAPPLLGEHGGPVRTRSPA